MCLSLKQAKGELCKRNHTKYETTNYHSKHIEIMYFYWLEGELRQVRFVFLPINTPVCLINTGFSMVVVPELVLDQLGFKTGGVASSKLRRGNFNGLGWDLLPFQVHSHDMPPPLPQNNDSLNFAVWHKTTMFTLSLYLASHQSYFLYSVPIQTQ